MTPAQFAAIVQHARHLWQNTEFTRERSAELACEQHLVDAAWVTPITAFLYYQNVGDWLKTQTAEPETIIKHINIHKDCFQIGDLVVGRTLKADPSQRHFPHIRQILAFRVTPDRRVYAGLSCTQGEYHIDALQLARDVKP